MAIAIVWGLCFVLIQAALPSPAPLLLAGLRALIGGAVIAGWIVLRQMPPSVARGMAAPTKASWRAGLPTWPLLVLLALTNAALALGAMYLAAGRAEAAIASVLAGGQPLVLAAAGWVVFGERTSSRGTAGIVLAMAGVILIATTTSGATTLDGVNLSILASAAPAAGTVVMRRLGSSIDLLVTTSAQFLLGALMLIGMSLLFEPWGAVRWSPALVSGLLVLGIVGTGIAYVVWFWLLSRVSLLRLGTILYLVPVTGVVVAIVVGDRPAPIAFAGMAVVLAGIGLVAADASAGRKQGKSAAPHGP